MISLREEKNGCNEIGLEESGDYTIFIGSTNHKPISFTLTVKIAKSADIFARSYLETRKNVTPASRWLSWRHPAATFTPQWSRVGGQDAHRTAAGTAALQFPNSF